MKTIKLTDEQKSQMSYADVAYLVLKENGTKIQILELFKEVVKLMELPESYIENKIGDFFGLLSTDKRFIMLEKGFWDLKENHSVKVKFDEEDEEEEIIEEEIIDDESDMNDENEDENNDINYDDEDVIDDDEEEDDLKDLVIMDEPEDGEM